MVGFVIFLSSCEDDPEDELKNEIIIALKNDNTHSIDKKEWDGLVEFLNNKKTNLSEFFNDNNEVDVEILNSFILENSKYRNAPDNDPKIYSPKGSDTSVEISNVNFYFENSLSMNGYLKGVNFSKALRRVLNNLEDQKKKPMRIL
jgi:hypothetical protein